MAKTIIEIARMGGLARKKKLSTEERKKIAVFAASVRWGKKKTLKQKHNI